MKIRLTVFSILDTIDPSQRTSLDTDNPALSSCLLFLLVSLGQSSPAVSFLTQTRYVVLKLLKTTTYNSTQCKEGAK